MKSYVLDTSALLTLRDDEPGADTVEEILRQGQQGGGVRCFECFVSLMEVMYRVWRDEGEEAGRLAYEQCAPTGSRGGSAPRQPDAWKT